MGNITLGKSNQMLFEVDVNFPEQVALMGKCIEDAKKLVNKELLTFGRESEIADGDICYCVSVLAAAIFREKSKYHADGLALKIAGKLAGETA